MTTMLGGATLRIPPFLMTRTVPGSVTEIPVESWPTFATLYFAASWLSSESAPPFCALATAGTSPATTTAIACKDLKAFPFIANSFFPISSPREEKSLLQILFQSKPLAKLRGERKPNRLTSPHGAPPSIHLLVAAAVGGGVLHFLLGLARFALLRLQGVGDGQIGLRLSGRVGLGSGWRPLGYAILALIFRELAKAFADLRSEVVVHVLQVLQAHR